MNQDQPSTFNPDNPSASCSSELHSHFENIAIFVQPVLPAAKSSARKQVFDRILNKISEQDLLGKPYAEQYLRHTFATDLLNARMPLECLRVLLGHSNLEITRRYARLSDKTREEEYFTAMDRILKGASDENDQCDN